MTSGPDGRGTRMRHVLEILEGDVAKFLADIGLDDYRPRYSPVVRALLARGPMAIRGLAAKTRELLPLIEAEWTATTEAAEALEAELPYPLRGVLEAIVEALERKPFRQRIGETGAARALLEPCSGAGDAEDGPGEL